MLKFKTSCAVLAYLSSNLLNEVGLSLVQYFEVGLRVCDIVVNKFPFAISSSDEFLLYFYVRFHNKYITQASFIPDTVRCVALGRLGTYRIEIFLAIGKTCKQRFAARSCRLRSFNTVCVYLLPYSILIDFQSWISIFRQATSRLQSMAQISIFVCGCFCLHKETLYVIEVMEFSF